MKNRKKPNYPNLLKIPSTLKTIIFFLLLISPNLGQNMKCRVGYCLECESTSPKDCKKCKTDYKLEENGFGYMVCRPDFFTIGCKIENCEACKTLNSSTCMSCSNGFFNLASKDECYSYAIIIFFICIFILLAPPCAYCMLYYIFKYCDKKEDLIKNPKDDKKKQSLFDDNELQNQKSLKQKSGVFESKKEFHGMSKSPFVIVNNKSAMAKIREDKEDEEKEDGLKMKRFTFEKLLHEEKPIGDSVHDISDGVN